MTFKQGDVVEWTNATGIPAGTGHICGVATTEHAVIGRMYIVQTDQPVENYAYSCITLAECHLKLVPNTSANILIGGDEWVWDKGVLGRCMSC